MRQAFALLKAMGLVVVMLSMSAAPAAARRIYAGEEAAALRCANTMAVTAVALNQSGRMPEPDMKAILALTVMILERHVSGTWAEKKAAMRVMRDRRSPIATLDDFSRSAAQCLRQFPVN